MVSRASLLRKKHVILFLCVCAVMFLILRSSFSKDRKFIIPMYALTDIGRKDWDSSFKSSLYQPINLTSEETSFVYANSEFQTDALYIKNLQRYNNFLARTFSTEYADHEEGENKTNFGCICGRVSDACICCGLLVPKPTKRSLLTADLYKAVILVSHEGNTSDATFCLNVTYLPHTRRVRTSAVLLHYNASIHTKSLQGYKVLMDATTRNSVSLFNVLHLNILPLPTICAGNPSLPTTMDICTHFVSLDYKIKSEFGRKTTFFGCAYVQVVMDRRFIVARFPKFCFQAYQGAAADADGVENALIDNKKLPDNSSVNDPTNLNAKGLNELKDIVHPGVFDAHPLP